jgi:hypothetical protein
MPCDPSGTVSLQNFRMNRILEIEFVEDAPVEIPALTVSGVTLD